jgi:hypothetical protein
MATKKRMMVKRYKRTSVAQPDAVYGPHSANEMAFLSMAASACIAFCTLFSMNPYMFWALCLALVLAGRMKILKSS